ncbi:hypothetical protein PENARI_c034G09152, partial [Penicillium arizonense]
AKILSGRWVYKLKTDANGRPAKFKARWVARGNTQREGIDYEDAYAATGRYETLRVLLAVITLKKLYSTHLDVNLAYLNAILEEETYMQYPDGLDFHGVEPHGNVCRLRKSLYGLRQSAANWYKTLSSFLLSKGFNASSSDPCLYVRHEQGGGITIIFVYVDDMLLASTSPTTLQRVKEAIAKQWSISDLGEVSHYLSLKIQRDREAGIMKIGQKAYIDKFPDVPATSPRPFIPFSPSTELRKADEPANRENVKTYQSLTGSLIYASTVSRPDLSLALGMLTKHNLKPHDPHFSAVYQAVQYAKRTSNLTITYGRPKTSGNTGFEDGYGFWGCVDASFASDPDTMRSRTGWVFYLAGGPISWASKQQSCVTKSSAEAEYYALSDAGSQGVWLHRLLVDLQAVKVSDPIHLYSDSQSAISMAKTSRHHSRSRHIETHYHWIRERVEEGKIRLSHVAGVSNIADGLTKPLARPAFEAFRDALALEKA